MHDNGKAYLTYCFTFCSKELENKNSIKTVYNIEENLIDNSNKINNINLKLEELKEDIKNMSKPKILDKISNIFK